MDHRVTLRGTAKFLTFEDSKSLASTTHRARALLLPRLARTKVWHNLWTVRRDTKLLRDGAISALCERYLRHIRFQFYSIESSPHDLLQFLMALQTKSKVRLSTIVVKLEVPKMPIPLLAGTTAYHCE